MSQEAKITRSASALQINLHEFRALVRIIFPGAFRSQFIDSGWLPYPLAKSIAFGAVANLSSKISMFPKTKMQQ